MENNKNTRKFPFPELSIDTTNTKDKNWKIVEKQYPVSFKANTRASEFYKNDDHNTTWSPPDNTTQENINYGILTCDLICKAFANSHPDIDVVGPLPKSKYATPKPSRTLFAINFDYVKGFASVMAEFLMINPVVNYATESVMNNVADNFPVGVLKYADKVVAKLEDSLYQSAISCFVTVGILKYKYDLKKAQRQIEINLEHLNRLNDPYLKQQEKIDFLKTQCREMYKNLCRNDPVCLYQKLEKDDSDFPQKYREIFVKSYIEKTQRISIPNYVKFPEKLYQSFKQIQKVDKDLVVESLNRFLQNIFNSQQEFGLMVLLCFLQNKVDKNWHEYLVEIFSLLNMEDLNKKIMESLLVTMICRPDDKLFIEFSLKIIENVIKSSENIEEKTKFFRKLLLDIDLKTDFVINTPVLTPEIFESSKIFSGKGSRLDSVIVQNDKKRKNSTTSFRSDNKKIFTMADLNNNQSGGRITPPF